MSEIKLFGIKDEVRQLTSSEVLLEKELQRLIEDHMETFFGVRFLKSEYVIKNGRMDSIGIDENNCPVIFEYKRSSNENGSIKACSIWTGCWIIRRILSFWLLTNLGWKRRRRLTGRFPV